MKAGLGDNRSKASAIRASSFVKLGVFVIGFAHFEVCWAEFQSSCSLYRIIFRDFSLISQYRTLGFSCNGSSRGYIHFLLAEGFLLKALNLRSCLNVDKKGN
jgi:hypothetical protein